MIEFAVTEDVIATEPSIGLARYSVLDPRPNPICAACKCVMSLIQTLANVEVRRVGHAPVVWSCDGYACNSCGTRVLANFSSRPICMALNVGQDDRRDELVKNAGVYLIAQDET